MDKITQIPEDFIISNKKILDEKKLQTTYKIRYVSNYIEKWLYVVTNVEQVKNINFVDCMCNAGVYLDGDTGTPIRVLELFKEFALNHPEKEFNLILNDISKERIELITKVINDYFKIEVSNIHIIKCNSNVNDFLKDDSFFNKFFNCYPKRSANVVFVDPYNFCTVKISSLEHFLSNTYCELIYNIFTSDYVRNQETDKMQEFCEAENIPCCSKEEMIELITSRLKVGHIKFSFAYEFKTQTNTELYQIMFFTPNVRGLEKLKDTLWDTFDGKKFHRNITDIQAKQISFLPEEDQKDWRLENYSCFAQKMIISKFSGQILNYNQIEEYVIENTMLSDNHIIEYVIKPLIEKDKIEKLGIVKRANNYKSDKYKIGFEYENDCKTIHAI